MAIFISYAHENSDFVDKLAAHIVRHKANVWIDRWQLGLGDPIMQRVQEAIVASSAMLVVLSKPYVESEYCKKELTAGLLRELDEKRVVVLPVLLENCDIPVFLRDKLYADFRSGFETGLKTVLEGTARVTNAEQSRLSCGQYIVDWAEDWWHENGLLYVRFTIAEAPKDIPITLLTEIVVRCNDVATRRQTQYADVGLDWIGRGIIAEGLFDLGDDREIHLVLDDNFAKTAFATVTDSRGTGSQYDIQMSARRLGIDTGKIQLVRVSNYLKGIRDYVKSVSRKLTHEESLEVQRIMSTTPK